MRLLDRFLVGYSYFFHFVVALFVLGIATVVTLSGTHNLRIGFFPFTGEEATHILLYSSLIGLVTVLLGVTGIFRYAFPVWTTLFLVQAVRWAVLSPRAQYTGVDQFKGMLLLLLGAFGAWLSSLIELKRLQKQPPRLMKTTATRV